MASSYNKFHPFVEAMAEKVHHLGTDQMKLALCSAANAPIAADGTLSDLTEIDYTYCSTRNISTISSAQTGGTYKLILQDLTITAGGGAVGPFRYASVYNDTAASKNLVGWYDYGVDLTLADGESLTFDLNQTDGLFTLG